jgi:hypothetical protein
MTAAAAWALIVWIGGLGLAGRILPAGHSPMLRLAAAWPLGSMVAAWLMGAILLAGLPPSAPWVWACGAVLLLVVRPKDFDAFLAPPMVIAALAWMAWTAGGESLARLASPYGDGDALVLWQRRGIALIENGSLARDAADQPLAGYPHAVSLLHAAGLAVGGMHGLAVAKAYAWLSVVSVLSCFGALLQEGGKRIAVAMGLAIVACLSPLTHHASTGYADTPFTAHVALVVTLLLTHRCTWRLATLLGIVAGAAAFTKREGEALLLVTMGVAAFEPALDPVSGRGLLLRRLTTPLWVLAAAIVVMVPEILIRIVHGLPWPSGVGRFDPLRLPAVLDAIVADPVLLSMAIPVLGVAALTPAVLLAPRELARLATGPLRAATLLVAGLSVSYIAAILATPMWVSTQVETAGSRLLMHLVPAALLVAVFALGPRADRDPMARWNSD